MCAIHDIHSQISVSESSAVQSVSLNSHTDLFQPLRGFFRSVSLFLSCRLQTPPNFLCALPPPVRPHPRRESCTHDAMANGERTTHAPDMIFFLLSRHPHPIPPLVRQGVAWWSGVRVGEVRVLLRATLTSSMSVVR